MTALRESSEELAIKPENVEILGSLPTMYSLGNKARVWPIVVSECGGAVLRSESSASGMPRHSAMLAERGRSVDLLIGQIGGEKTISGGAVCLKIDRPFESTSPSTFPQLLPEFTKLTTRASFTRTTPSPARPTTPSALPTLPSSRSTYPPCTPTQERSPRSSPCPCQP